MPGCNTFVRAHELGELYPGPVDVRFGEGTGAPLTLEADDGLRWAPLEGGPTLKVRVEEMLREV